VASYYQSTQSLFIQASPDKVYEALTHWALRSEWRRGIEIKWEGEDRASLNQKVTFKVKRPLFSYSFSFCVTGLEPPRRFYLEYTGKPLKGRAAVEINPEDKGSQVVFHWMKVEPAGWKARLFFTLGLGLRTHQARTAETLQMLKGYLEGSKKSENQKPAQSH
jgi:uncharacterized protein YndB with AHSA1/START domain